MGFFQRIIADTRSSPSRLPAPERQGPLADSAQPLPGAGGEPGQGMGGLFRAGAPAGVPFSEPGFKPVPGAIEPQQPETRDLVKSPVEQQRRSGGIILSRPEISPPSPNFQNAHEKDNVSEHHPQPAEPDFLYRTSIDPQNHAHNPGLALQVFEPRSAITTEDLPLTGSNLRPQSEVQGGLPGAGQPLNYADLTSVPQHLTAQPEPLSSPSPDSPSFLTAITSNQEPVSSDLPDRKGKPNYNATGKSKTAPQNVVGPLPDATPMAQKETFGAAQTAATPIVSSTVSAPQPISAAARPNMPEISAPTPQVRALLHQQGEADPNRLPTPSLPQESSSRQANVQTRTIRGATPRQPPYPEPWTPEVKIGQIDVFIEGPARSSVSRPGVQRPTLGLASRHFLRRI